MQIITSTGFGDSGSSAVTDLLSEYEDIKSYNSEWECTFLHAPDGLGDLEDAIREGHRLKVDFAITRFIELCKYLDNQTEYKTAFKNKFFELSIQFVEDFTDVKWNGMYEERLPKFTSSLSKKQKRLISFAQTNYNISKSKQFDMYESDSWRPNYVPYTDMYYSCDLQKFYECAKKYTSSLFELAADGAERLYLDQLLPPISINKYLNYISNNIKVFVVDKDPRDLFIVENLFNGSRFIPYENINTFIKWYNSTRTKSLESYNTEAIYRCKLDDLVFDYENQCKKIEAFLGIKSAKHIKNLEKFNPEKSSVNIRLYEKYDNFTDEVKLIAKESTEFLAATYTYGNGVDKNDINKNHFVNPIINVMNACNEIQAGNIKSKKILIAIQSTMMISITKDFPNRKSIVKKIKGLVKIFAGLLLFPFELIYNLIVIFIYLN